VPDLGGYRSDGEEMGEDDWGVELVRSVALYLNGSAIPGRSRRGEPISDSSLVVLVNAYD